MISFPYTSIKTVGEDGAPTYDRAVDSKIKRLYNKLRYKQGVAIDSGDAFQVVADTGMNVKVKCNGAWAHVGGDFCYESAENRVLSVQAPDTLYDRIDWVVLRNDITQPVRACDLYIVTGIPASSPVAPALTNTVDVQEIGIATLFIAKNVNNISQDRISDTRLNESVCGVLSNAFGDIDASQFFSQLEALIKDLKEEIDGIQQGSEVMLKAVYGGSADGVVASADKIATPRKIGDADFDGSENVSIADIGISQPNLAVNTDFAHPYNPSGASTYSAGAGPTETIPGWKIAPGTVMSLVSDGVQLSSSGGGSVLSMWQELEADLDDAQQYTISALINGEIVTATMAPKAAASYGTLEIYKDGEKYVLSAIAGLNDTMGWIKLEKGTVATKWVADPWAPQVRRAITVQAQNYANGGVFLSQSAGTTVCRLANVQANQELPVGEEYTLGAIIPQAFAPRENVYITAISASTGTRYNVAAKSDRSITIQPLSANGVSGDALYCELIWQ